jgi:pimeloyl-ACP methyl ester carboxylesterase
MTDQPAQGYEARTFTAQDGLKIYFREYGAENASGTPVICVPGLTRSSKDFAELAEKLSAERRILCIDLRGRGQSEYDSNLQNYQPGAYINDILAMMTVADVHKAVFIGTSLGGVLTMALAAARPTAIAGAILNDIGPEIDPKGLARIASYVGKMAPVTSWEEAAKQIGTLNAEIYPDFGADDWMRFARRTFAEDAQGLPKADYDPKIGDAMRQGGGGAGDAWAQFKALQNIKTLVIRGEISDILSAETMSKMQQTNSDTETLTVPRVGHVPMLEEEPSFGAIERFLSAVDRKSKARAA